MISFIVVGKNEGWRLSQCLESIVNVINSDKINEFEIIYVDSKSSDDSIKRAMEFDNVNVYTVTGECNAAIGRNIGAKESHGDILFFIDGDMKLLSGAVTAFLDGQQKLIYPFCTGLFENYNHDEHWKFIEKKPGNYTDISSTSDSYHPVTGGLFLITKKLWNEMEGMDTRFVRSQDIDLGLRLSKKSILLLKKPVLIVHHYTISYLNKSRIKEFKKIKASYYRGLLLREHLFNTNYYKYAIRSDYTGFSLLFFLFLSIINPFFILIYIFIILVRVSAVKLKDPKTSNFFYILKDYFARDLNLFISFFFFHPSKKQINYRKVR